MTFILTMQDTPNPQTMGGKGASLAKAGQAFSVPAFIVVTPASFNASGLKPAAQAQLRQALDHLKGPFAVRSSAVDEDGDGHSFAGQLESYLNVPTKDVRTKVHAVWQSAFADSVSAYRQERGANQTLQAPAVVIQQMIAAEQAGVAFSVDPVHPHTGHIAIAAVHGLGDKLVGGEETGDSYTVTPQGTLITQNLDGLEPVLTPAQLTAIAALAKQAEAHYGSPQDIEWAWHHGTAYLLQSRPITTLADGQLMVWDNANIVESYSGVTAPLTFSFARRVYGEVYRTMARVLGVPAQKIQQHDAVFANMLGHVRGHVYYNLLNWYRGLALLPGFRSNRTFMEGMMGVDEALPDHIITRLSPPPTNWQQRVWDTWCLTLSLLGLLGTFFTLSGKVKRFFADINHALAEPVTALEHKTAPQLLAAYKTLEATLLARWDAPLINDLHCMMAFGLSRTAMEKWSGDQATAHALHADFMIGQGDIISAEPAQRIHQMAALIRGDTQAIQHAVEGQSKVLAKHPTLQAAFQSYLDKFGDRCTQELKLESITLHEDPTTLLQAIGYAAQKPAEASASTHDDTPLHTRLNALLQGKPVKRWLVKQLLKWAKRRVRDRENLRFERTRVFGRVRRIMLALGQQLTKADILNTPRDIFFLTIEEILALENSSVATLDLKALTALRQQEYTALEQETAPPARFATTTLAGIDIRTQTWSTTAPPPLTEGALQGIGCCRGVLEAKVRVIHDPRTEALQPGEIMVARHTDPGWIALFANAAGILVERGSLLSHSAIVAREMGIPAIVAIPQVMTQLKTGDTVRMNGATGHIEVLS